MRRWWVPWVVGLGLTLGGVGVGGLLLPRGVAQVGDLQEAQRLAEQALQLYRQGRYREALLLLQRSLAIKEKVWDPEDPYVALSLNGLLNGLALVYAELGNYGEAERLLRRSLAILEKVRVPEHPQVAVSLTNLAALSWAQGRLPQALALFQQATEIEETHIAALGAKRSLLAVSVPHSLVVYFTTSGMLPASATHGS